MWQSKGECGRVHLPVAPKCNIKCNYCNRKYDCVNESRARGHQRGAHAQAGHCLPGKGAGERAPHHGGGHRRAGRPLRQPEETLETIRLIRQRFPDLLLCLATNGLGLPPYLDELAELEVSHVTLTVNAVDPEIGAKIYSWVRDGKVIYRGLKAAEVLLERQLESIAGLKARGITVKVNTIVIPGINDHHVQEVAKKMAELGVDILNCMPMYPNADTPFGDLPEPPPEQMTAIRREAEKYPPDAPLHPVPGRRGGAAGRGPHRRIPGLPVGLRQSRPGPGRPALRGRGHPGGGAGQPAPGRSGLLPDMESQDGGFQMAGGAPGPRPGGGRPGGGPWRRP